MTGPLARPCWHDQQASGGSFSWPTANGSGSWYITKPRDMLGKEQPRCTQNPQNEASGNSQLAGKKRNWQKMHMDKLSGLFLGLGIVLGIVLTFFLIYRLAL